MYHHDYNFNTQNFSKQFRSTISKKFAFFLSAIFVFIVSNETFSQVGNTSYAVSAAAPTSPGNILGELCVVYGTSLSVSGGGLSGNNIYQWGTGNTAGANIFASGAYTNSTYVNPTTATKYWVRVYNTSNGQASAASFATVTKLSTAPDYIAYVPRICPNTNVTLNALGGINGSNATFQWGTGTTGTNIIAGATTASIVVSPAVNTKYWARRIDGAPCNNFTDARTIDVTVADYSVAPTAITSSATLPLCGNNGTTLYANGTVADGGNYQWGTGEIIGENILNGQNSSNMWISPTVTTTYWVRLKNGSPCNTYTNGVKLQVTVRVASITPTSISSANSTCLGSSITLTAVGGSLGSAGNYQWGTGWSVGNNIISGANGVSINVSPTAQTIYWVRTIDESPCYVSWIQGPTKVIDVTSGSSAPTSITGAPTSTCGGTNFTLNANGGNGASGSYYQWGTGNIVGENVIAGANQSITTNASETTKFWVRRYDPSCGSFTLAATVIVTIKPATVAGTLSTPNTVICKNTLPAAITLSGNVGNVLKWQRSDNSSFSGFQNLVNNTNTLSGAFLGLATSTKYYRALVQSPGCVILYTEPIAVHVGQTVTYSGSWNGELTTKSSIVVSQNLTLSADLEVCSCKVTGNAKITVPAGKTLIVEKGIEITPNAEIVIENNGSLLQIDELAVNIGNVKVKRQTTPMRATDFTYWSTPVAPFTLTNVSPATKSDKFFSFDANINNWQTHLNGAVQMQNGKGYIVRAPQGWSLTNLTGGKYTSNFVGTPNNGLIEAPLVKNATGFNLIGNPYPSAIDIDLFLTDPANENLVQGTVYLWTHNTGVSASIPGTETYNYSTDDYAKYNLTGGVKTASGVAGGVNPTGKIAVGQAFFIEANPALANGNYSATFNNSMRVVGNNDQFFRTTTTEKNRVWINITNNAGAYDEALIGYVSGATNEFDTKYDGATFPAGNPIAIYSILETTSLSIQGRALPFDQTDSIPLGYVSNASGNMTIALDNFDGLFADQNVYLFDNTTATLHNLKNSSYTFTTTSGTFNNRFELRFAGETLSVENPISQHDAVIAFADDKTVFINAPTPIMNATIYDLNGKLLFNAQHIDATTFEIPMNIAKQLIVVKITLDENTEVVRKVIIK